MKTEAQKEKVFNLYSLISLEILNDCILAQNKNRKRLNFLA